MPGGSEAVMIVRPERITVLPLGDDGAGPGTWEGTVRERTFLGSVTRLTIAVAEDIILADIPGEATAAIRLGVGDRVQVAFERDGCRLLPSTDVPVAAPA
jgi:ABC-type Fe3+/spermidine/putrescine transport system ATPase subunit